MDAIHDPGCDCLQCKHTVLAHQERFDRPDAAVDLFAARHQFAVLARHVLDDDLEAAKAFLREISFGVEVGDG